MGRIQLGAGRDPELGGQRPAGPLVRPQRLRTAFGGDEGAHEQRPSHLACRVVGDEPLELGDRRRRRRRHRATTRRPCPRPPVELDEPGPATLDIRPVGEVGERLAPPPREVAGALELDCVDAQSAPSR